MTKTNHRTNHRLPLCLVATLLVAACAPQPPRAVVEAPQPSAPMEPPPAAQGAAPAVSAPRPPEAAFGIDAYKMLVANEIWLRNTEVYAGAVPPMLKSIVVLEITIDRVGNPIGISVYRSNGFKQLESRALESIVRAAPFAIPPPALLQGLGSVTFLETFLFRADERFQLRSLVIPPARVANPSREGA